MFPNNKRKAVTFSFDDGVTQDRRLVELLNKYNLKGTFNLNSLTFGTKGKVSWQGKEVNHNIISIDEVKDLYKGHEVAVHTLSHTDLCKESNESIVKNVEEDRINLEKIVGYPIVGMAYPYGTTNNKVINILKNHTKIAYSRGVEDTYSFDVKQEDLLNYKPTIHSINLDEMEKLVDKFISMNPDEDQILYIWGHAYEFDFENTWNKLEAILIKLSNKNDIFYGTNKEILLSNK